MSRVRLQGHNEAEAWRTVTDTWPGSDLTLTWNHQPIEHWMFTVKSPALGHQLVTAYGATRYEALHRILVALEEMRLVQAEQEQRAWG